MALAIFPPRSEPLRGDRSALADPVVGVEDDPTGLTDIDLVELRLVRLRQAALMSGRRHGLTAAERAEHQMLCDRERELLRGR